MKAAIYSRKSKYTGKGESIENQIRLCLDYARDRLDISESQCIIYEDEGFSGGNVDRPQFQQLLRDAKEKQFDVLICYRLDRISRNVADFSSFMERLQKHDIGFVSIREQFDTTTPMGRAMLYISSVFAQLERETIAERIRDNMMHLARSGRWLGGVSPLGYTAEKVTVEDAEGKARTMYKLVAVAQEAETVRTVYREYLNTGSLVNTEKYCCVNDITSRNAAELARYSLRFILSNPVYCTADEAVYDYLTEHGCEISSPRERFTGEYGVMAYNKTAQSGSTNRFNEMPEWIVAVGAHAPLIDSETWIAAQRQLERNKDKTYRKPKNNVAILSGILRCKQCGSFMRPKNSRIGTDGVMQYHYMCELKERSRRTKCNMPNANGLSADAFVVQEILGMVSPASGVAQKISEQSGQAAQGSKQSVDKLRAIRKELTTLSRELERLAASLATLDADDAACAYIIEQINTRHARKQELESSMFDLERIRNGYDADAEATELMRDVLEKFAASVGTLSPVEKREMLRTFIDRILWDGKALEIQLFRKKKF